MNEQFLSAKTTKYMLKTIEKKRRLWYNNNKESIVGDVFFMQFFETPAAFRRTP